MISVVAFTFAFQLMGLMLSLRATRNIFSALSFSQIAWVFTFIGGWMIALRNGHFLTPLYLSIGSMCIGLGAILVNCLMRFSPLIELRVFRQKRAVSIFKNQEKIYFISLLFVTVLSLFMSAMFFVRGGIPIFSDNPDMARIVNRAGLGVYVRFLQIILPFIILIWLSLISVYKGKKSLKIVLVVLIAFFLVLLIFWGYKGTFLSFFVMIAIFASMWYKWKPKVVLWIGIIILLGLVSAVFMSMATLHMNTSKAVPFIVNRMTIVEAEGFDKIVYFLVPREGLLGGRSFVEGFKGILVSFRLLPREKGVFYSLPAQLVRKVQGSNLFGFAYTITVMGDLYANFGLLGSVLGMLIFGMLLQGLYILSIRGPKDHFLFPNGVYGQMLLLNLSGRGGILAAVNGEAISWLGAVLLLFGIFCFLVMPSGSIKLFLPRNAYHKIKGSKSK